jgi:protein N-terminal glutamine amidohydrolase
MKHAHGRGDPKELGIALKKQPFYCEENVWHLCQEPLFASKTRHVVFISNLERAVPMWNQRAGRGKPIVWDYHVIMLVESPLEVWDADTTLGLPTRLFDYLEGSFHPYVESPFAPSFRVVRAEEFVEVFASDRSHMQRADGSFRKPPPSWPMIGKPGTASNLMHFIDMGREFVGDVLSLPDLREKFLAFDEQVMKSRMTRA